MCVCVYVYTSYIHIYTFSGRLALGVLDHSRVVTFAAPEFVQILLYVKATCLQYQIVYLKRMKRSLYCLSTLYYESFDFDLAMRCHPSLSRVALPDVLSYHCSTTTCSSKAFLFEKTFCHCLVYCTAPSWFKLASCCSTVLGPGT